MSLTISIEQASAQLSGLVRALGPNDEIVLTDNNKPVARIVPNDVRSKRMPGAWKGILTVIKEDDSHLDDFREYMPRGSCSIPKRSSGSTWKIQD